MDDPPSRLWLTDGGVYDNLGMQTVQSFHTVLASDGGAPLSYATRVGHNWGSQTLRTVGLVYAQVSRLRRHQFVDELVRGERLGALWTIATRMTDYTASGTLPCPFPATRLLADLPTRLAKMPAEYPYEAHQLGLRVGRCRHPELCRAVVASAIRYAVSRWRRLTTRPHDEADFLIRCTPCTAIGPLDE